MRNMTIVVIIMVMLFSISTSATQQPTFSRHSSASPVKRGHLKKKYLKEKNCSKNTCLKEKMQICIIPTTVPMNRIVVGTAPSPNLWNTQSRWPIKKKLSVHNFSRGIKPTLIYHQSISTKPRQKTLDSEPNIDTCKCELKGHVLIVLLCADKMKM